MCESIKTPITEDILLEMIRTHDPSQIKHLQQQQQLHQQHQHHQQNHIQQNSHQFNSQNSTSAPSTAGTNRPF